ncbi:MAG: carbohydrate kinase family protein [Eubacterium sp.]|nr:carbohydrate kinase family protein [Eubacterium sp.]
MTKFAVAGITQLETIVEINSLPVRYVPVTSRRDFITSEPSGDAFNICLALNWLEDTAELLTVVGKTQDMGVFNPPGRHAHVDTSHILPLMDYTPQKVVFYQDDEHTQIFEDMKDVNSVEYDIEEAEKVISECDFTVISNVGFCRPFLSIAKKHKKPIAVRVNNYRSENEKYNAEFLSAASIIYFSNENLRNSPYDFIKEMSKKYTADIILLGIDETDVLLFERSENIVVPYKKVTTIDRVNSHGAGNAFFSCFLHSYAAGKETTEAVRDALLFASYNSGFKGASTGFLTPGELDKWRKLIWKDTGEPESTING